MILQKTSIRLQLLLPFLLLSSLVFPQQNFIPGFVITHSGDTLKGLVDYRKWYQNPSLIVFKQGVDQEKEEFSPLTISGFSVNGESYMSAIVQREISSSYTGTLEYKSELNLITDTVFLLNLVSGPKWLFQYKDENNRDNFYITTDSSVILLVYKKFLKSISGHDNVGWHYGGKDAILENKTYLGQLTLYFEDCPGITKKIGNTSYTETSLYALFSNYYNKCIQSAKPLKKKKALSTEFGVLAGLSLNSLILTENSDFDFTATDYGFMPNYTAGLFFDMFFPGNAEKWAFRNELQVAPYHVKGEYNDYVNENRYTIITTEFKSMYLKLNSMIKYSIPIHKVSLFLNAGISNAYADNKVNYCKREYYLYDTKRVTEDPAFKYTDNYEFGYNFGMGLEYAKFSFETRYEQGDGMSHISNVKSTTSRLYFLLGYRF